MFDNELYGSRCHVTFHPRDRIRIFVNANRNTFTTQRANDLREMAASSKSTVHIDSAWFNGKTFNALFDEYWYMVYPICYHVAARIPVSTD